MSGNRCARISSIPGGEVDSVIAARVPATLLHGSFRELSCREWFKAEPLLRWGGGVQIARARMIVDGRAQRVLTKLLGLTVLVILAIWCLLGPSLSEDPRAPPAPPLESEAPQPAPKAPKAPKAPQPAPEVPDIVPTRADASSPDNGETPVTDAAQEQEDATSLSDDPTGLAEAVARFGLIAMHDG